MGFESELFTWVDELVYLINGPQWHQRAACRGMGSDLFFPEYRGSNQPVIQAIKVCRTCPVRTECLEDALGRGERYGVWGGMSERERRRIRRNRKAA